MDRDDFGRIESSVSTYPAYGGMGVSTLTNTKTWNDAGLVTMMRQITAGPQTIDLPPRQVFPALPPPFQCLFDLEQTTHDHKGPNEVSIIDLLGSSA